MISRRVPLRLETPPEQQFGTSLRCYGRLSTARAALPHGVIINTRAPKLCASAKKMNVTKGTGVNARSCVRQLAQAYRLPRPDDGRLFVDALVDVLGTRKVDLERRLCSVIPAYRVLVV